MTRCTQVSNFTTCAARANAAGVALRRGYWTLEADFQWMLWSKLDQVAIVYQNAPTFSTTLPLDCDSGKLTT